MWGRAHRPAEPDGVQSPDGHHAERDGHHEVDQREPVDLLRGEEEVPGDRVGHGREAEPQLRDTPGVSPGRGLQARPPPPPWALPAAVAAGPSPDTPDGRCWAGAQRPAWPGTGLLHTGTVPGADEGQQPGQAEPRRQGPSCRRGDLHAVCWVAGGVRWHWQGRWSLSELAAPASSCMDGPGREARLWTPRWTRARGQLAESHEGTVGATWGGGVRTPC